MNGMELLVWAGISVLISFLVERSLHALWRRLVKARNRTDATRQALEEQRILLRKLLIRSSICPGMKRTLIALAKGMVELDAANQFAAWLDYGEPEPSGIEVAGEAFRRALKNIEERDKAAAEMIDTFVKRASAIMLLQSPPANRSLQYLALRNAEPSAMIHSAVLMQHATHQYSPVKYG